MGKDKAEKEKVGVEEDGGPEISLKTFEKQSSEVERGDRGNYAFMLIITFLKSFLLLLLFVFSFVPLIVTLSLVSSLRILIRKPHTLYFPFSQFHAF